jgi:trimeric autotransporter adhesin
MARQTGRVQREGQRRKGLRGAAITLVASLGLVALAQPAVATPAQAPYVKGWGANNTPKAQVIVGNTLYLGGSFKSMISADGSTTVARLHLAAIDLTTGDLLPWNPGANGTVEAMVFDGTNLILGGSFTKIGNQTRNRLGAVSLTGSIPAWATGADNSVLALALRGSTVYVGGQFLTLGGQSRTRLGAVTTSGALLDWSASADDRVRAITLTTDDVVVGGTFLTLSGTDNPHIGRLDAATGAVLSWNYNASAELTGLVTGPDNNVYGSIGGGGGRVRSWSSTGTLRWTTWFDGDVNAITYFNGQVIAGGHWVNMLDGSIAPSRLAALNPSNGAVDMSWIPKPNKQVWALGTDGTTLVVGGVFTSVSKSTYRRLALYHSA